MFRDNSWNDRKTFKRLNPSSDCFKNKHDPVYSYFGRGGFIQKKAFIQPVASSQHGRGAAVWERKIPSTAEHLPHTTDMGEWGWQRMRSIHAWGWAQGNLTPTSQSTVQQELGVMPCDVLYLHLSGAPCEGHAVSASVHCYRSAPVTHNHQAREGYCWHPSAVKTELKMQQSATGAVSYCQ